MCATCSVHSWHLAQHVTIDQDIVRQQNINIGAYIGTGVSVLRHIHCWRLGADVEQELDTICGASVL